MKTRKKKRLAALLLCLSMAVGMLPLSGTAFAAELQEQNTQDSQQTQEEAQSAKAAQAENKQQAAKTIAAVNALKVETARQTAPSDLLYEIDSDNDWNNLQAWLNNTAAPNAVVKINYANTSHKAITIPNKNITIENGTLTGPTGLLQLNSTEKVVLTIKNLNMSYSSSGIDLYSGSTLIIAGNNIMTPSAQDGSAAAIHVPQGNILTLTGDEASSLTITSTKNGAGIGGEARDNGEAAGTINITSGKVAISAINGAGIGGGGGLSGAGGTGGKANISGTAEVEITMTGGGAGIGGGGNLLTEGAGGANDETTISGGKVTVYAKDGAGIGGGSGTEIGGAGGTVKISGSDTLVNVTMTRGMGAGIGGGGGVNRAGGAGGNVTIAGGIITVTALNNDIGGGDGFLSNGDGGTLTIDSTGTNRAVLDMRGKGTNATLDHSIGTCQIKDASEALTGYYSKLIVVDGTARSNDAQQKDYWKPGIFKSGSEVELTANTPPQGKYFSKWTAAPALTFADAAAAVTSFTMPQVAQAVKANYAQEAAPTIPSHEVIPGPDDGKPLDLTKDAVFAFEGEFANVAAIRINGHALTQMPVSGTQASLSGYPGYASELGDVKAGSVIVTLYKEFLQTLPDGTYTLEVEFLDGRETSVTDTQFEIRQEKPKPAHDSDGSAATGDASVLWPWVMLMMAALAGGAPAIGRKRSIQKKRR